MVPPGQDFPGTATKLASRSPADPQEDGSVIAQDRNAQEPRAEPGSEECNGAQSCAEERGRCRTGERGRQGAFTGCRRVRGHHGRADDRICARRPVRAGFFLKVVKNTLASRAVEGTEFECVKDALDGPLLYAFSNEDPGAAGRLIKDFAKANEQLKAKLVAWEASCVPATHVDVWPRCRPAIRRWHAAPCAGRARQHVRPRRRRPRPTIRAVANAVASRSSRRCLKRSPTR